MLFQEREPAGNDLEPILGGIDPLPQGLILGFELAYALASLGELGPGQHATVGPSLLHLPLGLQGPSPPCSQLLGQMAHDLLQLGQGLLVGSFVVV
jgi:hypothetical protein